MKKPATKIDSDQAKRILLVQAIMTLGVAILLLGLGLSPAYSALIGGATATLANMLFAWLLFARYHARQPGNLVARFYLAEAVKLLFIGLCFGSAVVWVEPLDMFVLLITFFIIQILPVIFTR
ncbi:MAG: ATP synthase subunit I [Gammaproteobacteria bacterium]|nr:ATP synthase subunit I [Gammaproteobacteria bacterium]